MNTPRKSLDLGRTAYPLNASGSSTPVTGADGYLLLTIPHAILSQTLEGESSTIARGGLRLECVSVPIPADVGKQTANPFAPSPNDPLVPTHDFWLVLFVGPTFEMPVVPRIKWAPATSAIKAEGIKYHIPSLTVPGMELCLTLSLPASNAEFEDLDSFEVLLRQYGSLVSEDTALTGITAPTVGTRPGDGDMRGKLVLINEDNGEIVGELDQRFDADEDRRIAQGDKDQPVILDFGNVIDGYAPQIQVKQVPEDEMDDWILKGAHHISRGILGFGSGATKVISSGADLFIRNTKAYEKPVQLSSTTKAGIRMTHNASVRGVKVTKKTMGMINNALLKVADKTYETVGRPAEDFYKASQARRASLDPLSTRVAPPVPPRIGTAGASPTIAETKFGAPPVPARKPSPDSGFVDEKAQAQGDRPPAYTPGRPQTLPIDTKQGLADADPAASGSSSPVQSPVKKRGFLKRVILGAEVVLSSLEATAENLIQTGTSAASSAAGHKFGPEAERATALLGGSVRNVAVVYIDVRGVGRTALLKGTAEGFVKARLKGGEEVQLQAGGRPVEQGEAGVGEDRVKVDVGGVEHVQGGLVVGVPEVTPKPAIGEKKAPAA